MDPTKLKAHTKTLIPEPDDITQGAAQVIREAREIVQRGWCKNVLRINGLMNGPARYCLMGGLGTGLLHLHLPYGNPEKVKTWSLTCDTVRDSIKELFPDRYYADNSCAHALFNDHKATTQADVIKVLDHSLKTLGAV